MIDRKKRFSLWITNLSPRAPMEVCRSKFMIQRLKLVGCFGQDNTMFFLSRCMISFCVPRQRLIVGKAILSGDKKEKENYWRDNWSQEFCFCWSNIRRNVSWDMSWRILPVFWSRGNSYYSHFFDVRHSRYLLHIPRFNYIGHLSRSLIFSLFMITVSWKTRMM